MSKKRTIIKLSKRDRDYLKGLSKAGECRVRVYKRARTLLLADEGLGDAEIREQADLSLATLKRIRRRYVEEGIGSIWEKPKSGRPSIFGGEQRAKIPALACSEAPEGYARWSLRLLADKAVELGLEDIAHETVGVILKKPSSNL